MRTSKKRRSEISVGYPGQTTEARIETPAAAIDIDAGLRDAQGRPVLVVGVQATQYAGEAPWIFTKAASKSSAARGIRAHGYGDLYLVRADHAHGSQGQVPVTKWYHQREADQPWVGLAEECPYCVARRRACGIGVLQQDTPLPTPVVGEQIALAALEAGDRFRWAAGHVHTSDETRQNEYEVLGVAYEPGTGMPYTLRCRVVSSGAEQTYTGTLLVLPTALATRVAAQEDGCECDNGHQQNDTVCRWCWDHGRRHWNDPEVQEGE